MRLPLVALALLAPAPALAASNAPPRVAVHLAFIEPTGKTLAEKKIDAVLGSETATEVKDRNRTISIKTTVRVAAKPDCYLAEIAVRDQDIDPAGRFSRKEWQTRGEVCGGFFITLGPREETRVRLSVERPPAK
jgi:hypothetical protein